MYQILLDIPFNCWVIFHCVTVTQFCFALFNFFLFWNDYSSLTGSCKNSTDSPTISFPQLPQWQYLTNQETDTGIINQSMGLIQFSLVFTHTCVCAQFFYTENIWRHHSQCSELFHQPRGAHSFMIPFYNHSPLVLLPIPEQTLISSPAL